MNKKRKILTVVALAVFGAIIFYHYSEREDVRLPIFALGVFYAGLFFLFGGKDAAPMPRRPVTWRDIKIMGVIIGGLVVIGGLIGVINYFQEEQWRTQEEQRRSEQSRRDAVEEEDSKHRITSSEIDLIDLRLQPALLGDYYLTGRIRNRAAHNSTLNSITLTVTLREKEDSPDILGQETVQIRVEVPPHQTRGISQRIYFADLPQLTQVAWTYFVTEIRGSKRLISPDNPFKDFDPDKYLGLTPTPSPTPDVWAQARALLASPTPSGKPTFDSSKPYDVVPSPTP